ncbi:uracil-DNA glycosylase [Buchnera aphidicola (Ceratoglyphina bambusae)]|uniref:uracil-DNA glycosylase n=1 Tax=Buchnera aphidicola TaxID=9 RepID=UPI0031B7EC9B
MKQIITWRSLLKTEKKKKYFLKMLKFLKKERKKSIIYPSCNEVFSAFKYTNFDKIKVVIVGQDPYSNFNQANGLAFSVRYGQNIPPSLRNIFKELKSDIKNFVYPSHGFLKKWALQGVFLLNSILTVEKDKPGSHKKIGWLNFTNVVIKKINKYKKNVIFLLWGNFAKQKIKFINFKKHIILISSHPSPYSAYNGFIGCKHFSKVNNILTKLKKKNINWNI